MFSTSIIYWRWYSGTLSRLHRTHPHYPKVTWCGALRNPGPQSGIDEVYAGGVAMAGSKGLEMCHDCNTMKKPMFIEKFEPPEVRAAMKAKRREVALKAAAERKRRREVAA